MSQAICDLVFIDLSYSVSDVLVGQTAGGITQAKQIKSSDVFRAKDSFKNDKHPSAPRDQLKKMSHLQGMKF